MTIENSTFKAGYVAVVGQPNVGKSTLTNSLLRFPLAITTAKPQTTRHRILGIDTNEQAQIIFLDTPGLIDPKYRMQEVMMRAANTAINDADVILFLIPAAAKPDAKDLEILERLRNVNIPLVLVINKMDKMADKNGVLPLINAYQKKYDFDEIIPISALQKMNLDELRSIVTKYLPFSPPFFPPDQITQHPERFFVSELIREQIFLNYSEEIPFSTAVVIDEFKERDNGKDYIKARIIVERQSQKKIIIGKGGAALRKVGQSARTQIEEFLERPVFLELWVAVRDKWRKKDIFIKEFGYDQN